MNNLFNMIIKIIDFFYQRKIINYFKNSSIPKFDVLIDVGAHKGETIFNFLKNFKIRNKYKETNIEILNTAVGNSNKKKLFNELPDSNSSTFNLIDQNSSYFKRKNKIMSFFFKKDFNIKKNYVSQIKLSAFIEKKNLTSIDILKIDTEGYELEVLKGLEKNIQLISFIYFEHHYDNMIKKSYKFSQIHSYLSENGFHRVFKIKMPLRKSFDYIYKKNAI